MGKGKSKSGTLEEQVARLKEAVGPLGVVEAEDLANSKPSIVRLAFKMIPRNARKRKGGLKKAERKVYFQLLGMDNGAEVASQYRNDRLSERGIDIENVADEPPQTDEEKAKLVGAK